MGTIPGPIISFKFTTGDLASSIAPELQKVRQQSASVSNGIAEDWKRMAAQIRASLASGLTIDKETVGVRNQLLGILDRQIAGYSRLSELSAKELSALKAVTLERERQADAIRRGGSVGTTAGTNAALGQVSQQTILGVERVLDSVINRYLGGAAGAAARTLRDVSYYSSLGSRGASSAEGAASGGGGALSGISGGISGILASVSPTTLAVGALVTSIAGTAGILGAATHAMTTYAQSVQNVSAATGLSYSETQKFRELAKITGTDADGLTQSFGRLQGELGKYIVSGKSSEDATQNFVKVLDRFNISVTGSGGKLRPIGSIISDFAASLAEIPDAETRSAIGLDALGVRGKILVQVIDNLRASGMTLKQALDEVSRATLSDDKIKELLAEKRSWDDLVVSVDAATLHVKAFIATSKGEIGLGGASPGALTALEAAKRALSFTGDPGSPSTFGVPSAASAQGLIAEYAARNNKLLLERAELTKAGGEAQLKLTEAEKNYGEAVAHSRGEDAQKFANEITNLKAVIELDKQRAEQLERNHRLYSEFALNPSTGSLGGVRGSRDIASLKNSLANPGAGVDPLSLGIGTGGFTDYLAGIIGPPVKPPPNAAQLLADINKQHEDLFKTQAQIDAEGYQEQFDALEDSYRRKLIGDKEYADAKVKLTQDLNKTLSDANKEFEEKAGSLFDDLISGKTKNFTTSLMKDIEDAALKPLKESFDRIVGGQLKNLADLFSGKTPNTSAPGTTPASGGSLWSRVIQSIAGFGSGKTPGWWPGATGAGSGGGTATAGQGAVGTMNVVAQVVNIATLGVATVSTPSLVPGGVFGGIGGSGGFGSFFGNTNPFGNSVLPAGTSGIPNIGAASPSALTNIFNKLSPFAAGGAMLGLGLATGNEATIAMGAAQLASKASLAISGISNLPAGVANVFSNAGAALPGAGIGAAGIISAYQSSTVGGKAAGTLEAVAGGALAGTAILPGIGTAIGAAVGLVGGVIASIIGGGPQGFAASVKHAQQYDQYHAPTSENFSFASNGSIASTLQTGFQQNGSQFSQYTLPKGTSFAASALTGNLTWQQLYQLQNSGINPNAPFLGNPATNPYIGQGPVGVHATTPAPTVNVHVNLPGFVDATSAAAAFTPHATLLSRLVSQQLTNSSSGFGSKVRAAAFPP